MRRADGGRPLIAVSGRRRLAGGVHTGPAQLDVLDIDFYFTGYADHLEAAGASPVYLPTVRAARDALRRVDGLVLSGGVDVEPRRYGAVRKSDWPPIDPARDEVELGLLEEAFALNLPILAICRGLQLVNVHLGGTLHEHLPDHTVGVDHGVVVEPASLLSELYGATTTVNSLHHQSVDRLGSGLAATGHAVDGVVEAIELPGADLLGVQWHPEQMAGPQPVFGWLASVARERAAAR